MKKSKKIIASLIMTLSLVSIFPMTNAFALTQEEKDFLQTCNEEKPNESKSGINYGGLYEKDGKYYIVTASADRISFITKSMFIGDFYAREDGSLVTNQWAYSRLTKDYNYSWRYFGANYNYLTGFQTVNGVRYYFSKVNGNLQIGWFVAKPGEWHYSYPDGSLKEKEGWVNSNGNWYYINSDGIMAKDTTTPDGYRVNNKGVWKS